MDNEKLSLVEFRRLLQWRDNTADSVIGTTLADLEGYSSFRAHWTVLSKHRWQVLTVLLVVLTVVTIYSFKMNPVYLATARMEIEAETPQIQSLNDLYKSPPTDEAYLETQAKILQSQNLAWRVIQQCGLANNSVFIRQAGGRQQPAPESGVMRDLLVKEFSQRLVIGRARNTHIVEVSFESTDPNLAARVVNTLVSDYVEYNFHKRYDATRQASGWMEQQLDELKAKVEESQQALVDYERQNAIVNVSDKQNVLEQRLSDLSRDLTVAESDRSQKESIYDLVKINEAQVAFIAQNGLLQKLEEKIADLKAQYVDSLGQYGPNFPRVVRLRDQVNEIQSLIDRERKRIVAQIRNDYLAALGREKLLAALVGREKTEVGRLNQLLIQHNILMREFVTNQQLYDSLLQRLKDATVSAGLRATNIHVVDGALPPTLPTRPKKLFNLAIGLIVGSFLGIALAFVHEGLDDSIKTAEDVERLIDAPSLAIIPAADSTRSRKHTLVKSGNSNGAKNGAVALAVLQEPNSGLAESYRALRTSILFSTAPRPPQCLLVTSSQPGEGKTCTSLNLSLALAQRGGRVLVVDADLRKPTIAKALGLTNEKGLSGVLTGAHSLDAALQQIETVPNLWVLAAGPHPPNPAELLSSASMDSFLGEARQRFEHVVLDSPPLLAVTDATILSTLVDGVILVVESGVTSRGVLARSHKTVKTAGSRILGAVLNKVNFRQAGYDYDQYYGSYPNSSDGQDRVAAEANPVVWKSDGRETIPTEG